MKGAYLQNIVVTTNLKFLFDAGYYIMVKNDEREQKLFKSSSIQSHLNSLVRYLIVCCSLNCIEIFFSIYHKFSQVLT